MSIERAMQAISFDLSAAPMPPRKKAKQAKRGSFDFKNMRAHSGTFGNLEVVSDIYHKTSGGKEVANGAV